MTSAHIEDLICLVHLHQAGTPWHTKVWWTEGVANYAAGSKLKLSLFYAFSYEIFFIYYLCFNKSAHDLADISDCLSLFSMRKLLQKCRDRVVVKETYYWSFQCRRDDDRDWVKVMFHCFLKQNICYSPWKALKLPFYKSFLYSSCGTTSWTWLQIQSLNPWPEKSASPLLLR